MIVRVKLFAVARQRAGIDAVEVELPAVGATVADLRSAIVEHCPALADVLAHVKVAVNNDYAADGTAIDAKAEVALIPPVSGG
ncbi:MAG TPA: molybdopterin converting factor subunit 1 [Pirellulaceae bacterium]|nr:molybdopterin converting factor subunit 1 [Pirellulaceae bacterium]